MFLCEKCIKKYDIDDFWAMMAPQSRGPCEGCKELAICADIHHTALRPVKSKISEEKNKGKAEERKEQKEIDGLLKKIGY
jgi:hypothetical protein